MHFFVHPYCFFATLSVVKAQGDGCATPNLDSAFAVSLPYYNNTELLATTLQQNGYHDLQQISFPNIPQLNARTTNSTFLETKYLIPLDLFIYRLNNDANTAISETRAREYVCGANEVFRDADTGIQFYVNTITIDGNSPSNNQISGPINAYLMFAAKRIITPHNGINVHFIRNTQGSYSTTTGLSSIPRFNIPLEEYSLFVRTNDNPNNGLRDNEDIISTFAHELGHNIGLLHTHHPGRLPSLIINNENGTISNGCYQEAAWGGRENRWYDGCLFTHNKKKSRINGDFLEDTQADPKLSGFVSASCVFTPPSGGDYKYDNWGDAWTPNTNNIMAYTQPICRNFFSEQQKGVMWREIPDLYTYINDMVPRISMPGNVCSSNTVVTLASAPTHANITWQVEPANLVATASGTGSTASLQLANASSQGAASITFSIVGNNNCYMARIKKDFWVGRPLDILNPEDLSGPSCMLLGTYDDFLGLPWPTTVPGATSYEPNIVFGGNPSGITFYSEVNRVRVQVSVASNASMGTYTMQVTPKNSCGTGSSAYATFQTTNNSYNCGTGGGIFSISPNPADSELTLNLSKVLAGQKSESAEVYIYNNSNEIIFQTTTTDKKLTISTNNIPEGHYHLRVISEVKNFQRHVIIKH